METSLNELREQFDAWALPLDAANPETLKARVFAVVDDAKAAGWPPERVIIAVKQIAREAGLQSSRHVALPNAQVRPTDQLLMDVVSWCIERYYHTKRAD